MNVLQEIINRAKAMPQRIVLPEGNEPRTLQAADKLLADGVVKVILLGKSAEIKVKADELGLKHIGQAEIIDPQNNPHKQTYIDLLVELRKSKGMTPEQAAKLVEDPLYMACLMIKNGDADGEVAGAINTTGNVLRPALQIIKTAPGFSCVSGFFMLFTKAEDLGEKGMICCADCAVIPNPSAEELAQIAVASAQSARVLAGIEPRVAMLSFSTKGSAKHEFVDKVVEATKLAQQKAPNEMIDGELQADAALIKEVGELKAPGSPVAGKANVLVFPSLEVGNIGYKLVQRLGHAEAIGPVLQGMGAPVNDLSRGCSVDDIYKLVAITANQAIALKK
ncbi:phosphotransacetylase [Porphyromonas crevioricanis]|uniref:Phosphate acetyltransferase n=2 Tax=Porphyromonas crevioricanis TaxID=393921 RepID=A0AB34PF63_9PORP|nr:phosphate acetyltransferase [Porphyromonas crevioricanis]KGN91033.1 phosphotransacetylase [Porphyromonas crevioricanis]KGN93492.1 phosphotransacetylase [Porphyromonas crevioricanis]GAD05332.1 phosphate acetyltransferase [Porphyromonas crevioricanis JCM 15906]SJZ56635.1 phosphate acetyltransferase [Porphyromonas crevioricanis]